MLSLSALPFVLLVMYEVDGNRVVKGLEQFATFCECYVKGKELQLYTINHPEETKDMVAAGCGECSKLSKFCGGTEL